MGNGQGNGGKTGSIAFNGLADGGKTAADNLVTDLERHADAILRAAGSGLGHYTFDGTRAAILAAVLECFQAGYCEGVDSVLQPVGEA